MRNNKLINFKKAMVLKRITKDGQEVKRTIGEKSSNSKEVTHWYDFGEEPINGEIIKLKGTELYVPYSYEQIVKLNKKKYRNIRVKATKEQFKECLENLKDVIENYKLLINMTELWEKKSTYDFNFKDWTTLKKANGKLTRYYNEIAKIAQKIESEEL